MNMPRLDKVIGVREREITELKNTIKVLVGLVDLLRQAYNNSKPQDPYEVATETLNKLEEEGRITKVKI